jgi:hypothetical protein
VLFLEVSDTATQRSASHETDGLILAV